MSETGIAAGREGQYLIPVLYYYFILRILLFTPGRQSVLIVLSYAPPTAVNSRPPRVSIPSCEAVSSSGGAGGQGRAHDGTGGNDARLAAAAPDASAARVCAGRAEPLQGVRAGPKPPSRRCAGRAAE